MGKYTQDGGVVSSKLPLARRSARGHRQMFGIYRGIVVRSIYPDEPESINKNRMEYVVRVKGQEYPNAVNIKEPGGIYNYAERVRKSVEKSITGKVDENQFNENLDGEHVWIMFVEGNGDVPLIVGGDTHPRTAKKLKKADGLVDVEEFNGVEMKIDKDSNFTITQVGNKDKDGKITNQDAVKSAITIYGKTGDIELNPMGTADTALRVKFTKKDKKLELYASDNKIVMDSGGINITDKGGDQINMKNGSVDMVIKGAFNVTSDGDTTITSKGALNGKSTGAMDMESDASGTFKGKGGTNVGDSGAPTNVDGQLVNLAGGGSPVARLGDMVIGTGNLGAPVVSQIMQGSPKVTSA